MDADVAAFRLLTLYQRLRCISDPVTRRMLQRQMDQLIAELQAARARPVPAPSIRDGERTTVRV
jgi:hypothetical protein